MAEMQTYVLLFEQGPNWVRGRAFYEQDLQEHRRFIERLLKEGRLELAGPFTDDSGGMAIVKAASAAEAARMIAEDPGVVNGVFTAVARPWTVIYRA